MLGELILTTGVLLIAYAFYKLSTNNAKYFEERNLKYKGVLTLLKNQLSVSFGKIDVFTLIQKMYDEVPDVPVYGQFDFSVRQYIMRDPEAFKQIAIKDFDHFEDHRVFIDSSVDELFGSSLIAMQGDRWRQMRATLSPAFTGSKMRQMFTLVSECADEIVKHFREKSEKGEKIDIEMKDFFAKYTNDVIATCAFGVKVNSFIDPNNEFYTSGKKLTNFAGSYFQAIKFLLLILVPKVATFLRLKFFDESVTKFFKSMILDTVSTRKNNNIHRPDVINLLMQVQEQGKLTHEPEVLTKEVNDGFATVEESDIGKATVTRKWTDNELVAQCFLFFFAGFEVSSSVLMFAAHELVTNPEIQQKLYEEIAEVDEQLGGKRVTYDTIQKMKYLDQVICETLRKWPTAGQVDRLCVKDYVYDDGDKLKFKIEKGSIIIFPVYGMHRDPKYYPNPEQFDPERFSDENKHKIIPGSYAPFGIGPRNCIGSRFALMELKAILYYLLLNFSFEVNKDTQIPLKMKKTPNVATEKGVNLELKPRSK